MSTAVADLDGLLGKTVLIVDDDPLVGRALGALLTRSGCYAAVARTGADALQRAQNPVAAAVVDIHLPDMNGLELTHQLRELLGTDVPIFVLSGDTSMQTIRALPEAGATYFFSKPVSADLLMQRMRDALEGRLSSS